LRNPNGETDYQYCWKQFGDHNSKLEKSDGFGQGVSNAKVKAGCTRIAAQRAR